MPDGQVLELRVVVSDPDDPRHERPMRLRSELASLPTVLTVEPAANDTRPPDGAKSIDGLASALIVSLVSGSIPAFVHLLTDWRRRQTPRCTIRLEGREGEVIEFNDVPADRIESTLARWAEVTDA